MTETMTRFSPDDARELFERHEVKPISGVPIWTRGDGTKEACLRGILLVDMHDSFDEADQDLEQLHFQKLATHFGTTPYYLVGLEEGYEDWSCGYRVDWVARTESEQENRRLGYEDGKEIRQRLLG